MINNNHIDKCKYDDFNSFFEIKLKHTAVNVYQTQKQGTCQNRLTSILNNKKYYNVDVSLDDIGHTTTYSGKQIVLTSTLKQLIELNIITDGTESSKLAMIDFSKRRSMMLDHFVNTEAAKIYMKFDKPWWSPGIQYKFCDHPFLTQMIYYSDNVLLIYVAGKQAHSLKNIFMQDFTFNTFPEQFDKWIKSSKSPTLVNYILPQIVNIIEKAVKELPQKIPDQDQLASCSEILFHFVEQANVSAVGTINPDIFNVYDYIRSGRNSPSENLWYITGDTDPFISGWTDTCLIMVDRYYKQLYDKFISQN